MSFQTLFCCIRLATNTTFKSSHFRVNTRFEMSFHSKSGIGLNRIFNFQGTQWTLEFIFATNWRLDFNWLNLETNLTCFNISIRKVKSWNWFQWKTKCKKCSKVMNFDLFYFYIYLGGILKWRQIFRGRGVSENLTLLNKISKFYTIKVWQGGEGGSKILKKDLTSFKDGPLQKKDIWPKHVEQPV